MHTSFQILGGMTVTIERLEEAAKREDSELILSAIGRLREQEATLRRVLCEDAFQNSIRLIRAENSTRDRQRCAAVARENEIG